MRKSIDLSDEVVSVLTAQAARKGTNCKKYMESRLREFAKLGDTKPGLVLNGDLREDILDGEATVVDKYFNGTDWFVLARTGHFFTEYKTDDYMELKASVRYGDTRPTALKRFRVSCGMMAPEKPKSLKEVVLPSNKYFKGMTRGDWEAIAREEMEQQAPIRG